MKKLLNDILKSNDPEKEGGDKFSLARVAFFVSFILYVFIQIFAFILIFLQTTNIEIKLLESLTQALQWPIGLSAAYAFGGKTLKFIDNMMQSKEINKEKN